MQAFSGAGNEHLEIYRSAGTRSRVHSSSGRVTAGQAVHGVKRNEKETAKEERRGLRAPSLIAVRSRVDFTENTYPRSAPRIAVELCARLTLYRSLPRRCDESSQK